MSQQPFSSDAGFSTVGNVAGANFIGDGSLLTNLPGSIVQSGAVTGITDGATYTTNTYTDVTGGGIPLPAAGTYQINYSVSLSVNSGPNNWTTVAISNASNTIVSGSTTLYNSPSSGYPGFVTGTAIVTILGAATYKLRIRNVSVGPTVTVNNNSNTGNSTITWVQIGSSLAASIAGNLGTTGNISATGNVTGANFIGSGAGLTGVAKQTTGSWSVTAGTNTYSFTVPINGTYSMWVTGNIPNGIIAWNATATVTNNNVPVVGQQYGWVYNGAGTPIDFVSIPNQFVGTGNAIVRSNASPSTTTNRFDFSINNTSGSTQTVNYGYVTL